MKPYILIRRPYRDSVTWKGFGTYDTVEEAEVQRQAILGDAPRIGEMLEIRENKGWKTTNANFDLFEEETK